MKYLFVFLFSAFSLVGYGQKLTSIDIVGGTDYAYRTMHLSIDEAIYTSIIERRNADETAKLNWRCGVTYNISVADNLYFKSGAHVSRFGYNGSALSAGLKFPNQHDGDGGFDPDAYSGESSSFSIDYHYFFVEMPMIARYEMPIGKFSTFLELGLVPSAFLISQSTVSTDLGATNDANPAVDTRFNRLHLFSLVSVGVNYDVTKAIQLFTQPVVRYDLVALSNARIKEHLYSLGLEFGARRMF